MFPEVPVDLWLGLVFGTLLWGALVCFIELIVKAYHIAKGDYPPELMDTFDWDDEDEDKNKKHRRPPK